MVRRVPLCFAALSSARCTFKRGHLTCVESYWLVFFLTRYTKLGIMVNLDKIKKTLR